MHIVVTGAAGFIGSHTCEQLVARGHRVTGLDAFDSYLYPADVKRQNARQLAQLPREQFALVEGNILDADCVSRVVDNGVDVVCHLAALAGVRPSIAQPQRYIQTNIEGTGVIVERMRALGLQRLVFASSSSVYGARPSETGAFNEDDPCVTPASPYAATKRANELQLWTYQALFGLGVHSLRFFTVYGPRQRPDMAIHMFTRAIARGERISLFGDGSSRRDYTYITDIVDGVVRSIEAVHPGEYEILNLGGTATTSLRDLVTLLEQTIGKSAQIEWLPDQPGDVPITYANVAKATKLLGYHPRTTIAEGVARFWDWYRNETRR